MPWEIDKPGALPHEEWQDFFAQQTKDFPVRWFIFDKIPSKLRSKWFRWRMKWWDLAHRFIPKYQYHIIKTSLEPNYYDPDTRILYATMDLVKEFVDINREQDIVAWDSDPEHEHAWSEMTAIHKWWTEDFANRKMPEFPPKDADKEEWNKVYDQMNDLEVQWAEEENEMLIRVMKIRKFLWYA